MVSGGLRGSVPHGLLRSPGLASGTLRAGDQGALQARGTAIFSYDSILQGPEAAMPALAETMALPGIHRRTSGTGGLEMVGLSKPDEPSFTKPDEFLARLAEAHLEKRRPPSRREAPGTIKGYSVWRRSGCRVPGDHRL